MPEDPGMVRARQMAADLEPWHADDPGSLEPPPDDGAEPSPRRTLASQLLSLSDLGNLPAVEPLIDGLLYRNTLAQLAGPPGSYKSFISVGLSCALAAGRTNWAGHRIQKREKVVYVAAEGASGLRVRILSWCENEKVDPADLAGVSGLSRT